MIPSLLGGLLLGSSLRGPSTQTLEGYLLVVAGSAKDEALTFAAEIVYSIIRPRNQDSIGLVGLCRRRDMDFEPGLSREAALGRDDRHGRKSITDSKSGSRVVSCLFYKLGLLFGLE